MADVKRRASAVLRGGLLAALVCAAQPAFGIPSFVRKYEGTSCTTCHVLPPKLNAFGRAFRNLGYRMPLNDQGLTSQKPVALGGPAWKKVWPKGTWPSSIPGGEFMAIALETSFTINPSDPVTNSFDGIDNLSLLLGGNLGESFSFFGALDFFGEGHRSEVGRVFFQYNNPSRYFNIKVGQFEPRAAPFSDHLRMTRQTSYLFNVFPTVPAGNFFGFSPHQRGIELWGAREGHAKKGGWLWSMGVVNGEFGEAADKLKRSPLGPLITELEEARQHYGNGFDVNSAKDFYFQSSYKIGGMGVFGSASGGPSGEAKEWRDNSLTVGAYYYRGTGGTFMEKEGRRHFLNSGDQFYRTGLSLDAWIQDLNVYGVWQRNHDWLDTGSIYDLDLVAVEADYVLPWPWIQPALRLEHIRPAFARRFSRWTASLSFMLRANAILTLDGMFAGRNAPDLPYFDDQVCIGFRLYF